ncbi:36240_t:CDS:1, partial [Gigaspora margarita]
LPGNLLVCLREISTWLVGYIAGFAKIKTTLDFDTICTIANEAHNKFLLDLPELLENIP